MKKTSILLCIFALCTFLHSCKKVDLTASYIYIDTTFFTIDVRDFNNEFATGYDQGELQCISSQRFPDAWVIVDGKDLGTWELPCKIPILKKDSAVVQIFPGIKLNGVSTSRPRYPFTDGYKNTIQLQPSQITTIPSLPIKYYSTTNFCLVENFEKDYNSNFHSESPDGVSFVHLYDTENPTERIGIISLEDSMMDFNVISENLRFNSLPSYAFLEMDYKCNVDNAQIYVGMLIDKTTTAVTTDEPLVVLNADKQWKKIYINLTQSVLRNQQNVSAYRVYLSGGRSDNVPVHFSFDNIKVLYR